MCIICWLRDLTKTWEKLTRAISFISHLWLYKSPPKGTPKIFLFFPIFFMAIRKDKLDSFVSKTFGTWFVTKRDAFMYRSNTLRATIIFITVYLKGFSTNSQVVLGNLATLSYFSNHLSYLYQTNKSDSFSLSLNFYDWRHPRGTLISYLIIVKACVSLEKRVSMVKFS